jgi:hypothetical protein
MVAAWAINATCCDASDHVVRGYVLILEKIGAGLDFARRNPSHDISVLGSRPGDVPVPAGETHSLFLSYVKP